MKAKITALIILTITAVTVMAFPHVRDSPPVAQPSPIIMPGQQPKIEVVFVLDTTGSMSGLIQAAKEKIWSIASSMASAQNSPEIKMGLVAYRDRGDAYVTKVLDLSSDLDSMYASLMDYKADGGGDGPESVNQALYDAIHKISWSQDTQTYKVVFLVGDAPPHMDYQDDVKYPVTLAVAQQKGIKVNAILSGNGAHAMSNWKQIASLGSGVYFQVEDSGNGIDISTPFDKQLAALSSKLDETKMYFGNREEKAKQQRKLAASDKLRKNSTTEAMARRAEFNISSSGAGNFLGEGELVDAISSGRLELSEIDADQLPATLQAMQPAEQLEVIKEQVEKRKKIKQDIRQLAEKRADYLKKEVAKIGGSKDSLDDKIYQAVRSQAAEKGLVYADESPSY